MEAFHSQAVEGSPYHHMLAQRQVRLGIHVDHLGLGIVEAGLGTGPEVGLEVGIHKAAGFGMVAEDHGTDLAEVEEVVVGLVDQDALTVSFVSQALATYANCEM